MNKLKLVLIAALLIGFSACDNTKSQKEEETKENTTQVKDSLNTEEEKEVIKETIRDNRTPNGSYFKAEVAGVEKIFDLTGKAVKANHYNYNPNQNSSRTRMVRYTSTEEERVSIQISGLLRDMKLPLSIPNDKVKMRFQLDYKVGESKQILKPADGFKLLITEIKGDSLIGSFEGFLMNEGIVNNDFTKIQNGVFRFKLEGMTPPM